jgi:hypothetical protein
VSQTVRVRIGRLDLSGVQPSIEKLKDFRPVVRQVDVVIIPFFVATSEGFAKEGRMFANQVLVNGESPR